jgi:hypothetical protein
VGDRVDAIGDERERDAVVRTDRPGPVHVLEIGRARQPAAVDDIEGAGETQPLLMQRQRRRIGARGAERVVALGRRFAQRRDDVLVAEGRLGGVADIAEHSGLLLVDHEARECAKRREIDGVVVAG